MRGLERSLVELLVEQQATKDTFVDFVWDGGNENTRRWYLGQFWYLDRSSAIYRNTKFLKSNWLHITLPAEAFYCVSQFLFQVFFRFKQRNLTANSKTNCKFKKFEKKARCWWWIQCKIIYYAQWTLPLLLYHYYSFGSKTLYNRTLSTHCCDQSTSINRRIRINDTKLSSKLQHEVSMKKTKLQKPYYHWVVRLAVKHLLLLIIITVMHMDLDLDLDLDSNRTS